MEEKTTIVFGAEGIANKTPKALTWLFRVEFVLNKVLLYVLGATTLLTPEQIKESLVWIAAVDLAVWGLGKFVGVKKEDYEGV